METSIKQRLLQFLSYKNIGQNKFEKMAGLSNGYIKALRHSPSYEKIQMIIHSFPELNERWLLTGEGEMLLSKVPNHIIQSEDINGHNTHGHNVTINKTEKDYLDIIKRQSEQLSRSQAQIDELIRLLKNKL